MALINILQEALKKIEYALRKASITDFERIQDIRIVVCNAISEIEIYCPDAGGDVREAALAKAAQDFIDKVDRGEARSKSSYAAFKAALSKPADTPNVSAEARLREALRFYADERNWIDTPPWDGSDDCITPKAIPVLPEDGRPCDCGETARAALSAGGDEAKKSGGGREPRGCPTPGACSCPSDPTAERLAALDKH